MSSLAIETIVTVQVEITDKYLVVHLSDGRIISLPLEWYPRLETGTPQERANYELLENGEYIHWPDLDEDLSTEGLIAGRRSGESKRSFEKWLENRRQ